MMTTKAKSFFMGVDEDDRVQLTLVDSNDVPIAEISLHPQDVAGFAAAVLSNGGEEDLAQLLANAIYTKYHSS